MSKMFIAQHILSNSGILVEIENCSLFASIFMIFSVGLLEFVQPPINLHYEMVKLSNTNIKGQHNNGNKNNLTAEYHRNQFVGWLK